MSRQPMADRQKTPRSVGQAGASAAAYHRALARRRYRNAGVVAGLEAVAVALLTTWSPRMTFPAVGVVLLTLLWLLTPSRASQAWLRGAQGEQRTAQILTAVPAPAIVLHDRSVPWSRANIDHLVIAPSGIWVIDTKAWRGQVRLDANGVIWHAGQSHDRALPTVAWIARRVAQALRLEDTPVRAVLAIHDARLTDTGGAGVEGVLVMPAGQVPFVIANQPTVLHANQIRMLATRACRRLPPATNRQVLPDAGRRLRRRRGLSRHDLHGRGNQG